MDINYYKLLAMIKKLVFMLIIQIPKEIKKQKNFGTELLS